MINPEKSYTMTDYLEILRRRVWFIVVPFIVALLSLPLILKRRETAAFDSP